MLLCRFNVVEKTCCEGQGVGGSAFRGPGLIFLRKFAHILKVGKTVRALSYLYEITLMFDFVVPGRVVPWREGGLVEDAKCAVTRGTALKTDGQPLKNTLPTIISLPPPHPRPRQPIT